NPRTGRPLTSADIYQTLFAQRVIGQRSIQREDLAQFGVTPAPGAPLSVVFGIVDDWKNAYSQQASLELEQGIGSFSVSAAYNFNRGAHIVRILDRNLVYGPRRPDGQPSFQFINPLVFQRNIFEPTANSFYHAGILQVNKRFGRNYSLNAHYTFSKAIDEVTDFNTDFQPHDQLNARGDRALSSFHQKHRFVGSAVLMSPATQGSGRSLFQKLAAGWVFSPIAVVSSGRPFNVLTGVDNLGDRHPNTHRPLRAGRNIGQGPAYFTLDARLARRFSLGKESRFLEFIAEGFNLLNRTNFRNINNTVGNITVEELRSPLTGTRGIPTDALSFTSAFPARQFQFGVKIYY
ncbi:MAG: TonB-dependent receptor, partial [Bryobacteraceae bacterium]